MPETTRTHCKYCGGIPNGTVCCEKAELHMLRAIADACLQDMDSEIVSPKSITAADSHLHKVMRATRERLRAARKREHAPA